MVTLDRKANTEVNKFVVGREKGNREGSEGIEEEENRKERNTY